MNTVFKFIKIKKKQPHRDSPWLIKWAEDSNPGPNNLVF